LYCASCVVWSKYAHVRERTRLSAIDRNLPRLNSRYFARVSFIIVDVASVEYEILLSPENIIDGTAFDDLTEVDVKSLLLVSLAHVQ